MDQSSLMQAPIQAQFVQDEPQQPTKPQPTGFEGFLDRNAQTIGSVAGGALGSIIGPEGSVLGSAAGGALGQWLKNETTGTNTNPFEEGAISGGLDLAGLGIGKAAKPILSKAGQVADKYGINLLSQVGGTVDRKTARALGAAGTTKIMSDLGVNPQDYSSTAQNVMNILTPLVRKGVRSASPVDTNGLSDMVDSLVNGETGINGMANESGTPGFKLSSKLKSDIEKLKGVSNPAVAPLSKSTAATTNNVLSPGADPADVADYISKLRDDVATLVGKGKSPLSVSDAARSEAGVKALLADELEDRLYHGSAANLSLQKGLVDEASLQKLTEALPNTPRSKQLVNAVRNAQTLGELRSAQAPFYNASKLAAEKETEQGTAGATNRSIARQGLEWLSGIGGAVAAPFTGGASAIIPAAEVALSTDTGKTAVGNTLRRVGQKLLPEAEQANNQPLRMGANLTLPGINQGEKVTGAHIVRHLGRDTLGKSIQQTLPRTAAAVAMAAGGGTNGNHSVVPNVVDTAVNEALSAMPQTSSIENGNNGVLSANQFQQLESQYGNDGINAYMQYIKMTNPELTQDQQTNWIQGQTLLSRIKQVAQLYSQSNAGPVSGRVSELLSPLTGGKSGAAGQTYDAQRDELANSLVKFINEGGGSRGGSALTTMLRQELPNLGDSAQTAATKFSALVQAITLQMQNNLAGPATNTPGQLTSFSGQQPSGGSAGTPSVAASNILNYLPPSNVNGF